MVNSKCIVCDNNQFYPFLKGLKKCSTCGYVVADIDSQNLSFEKLYNKSYFFGEEYVDYVNDKYIFQQNFKRRLQNIRQFCKEGNLIEIGCAYGFFLDVARNYFNIKGFEIAPNAADYAKKMLHLDVECGDFLKFSLKKNYVDVVAMWDVIEHLAMPNLYIEKAATLLKQNGLICLTTGDIEILNALFRKEKWRLIHPPTHIHYFSKKTIRKLLEKYGFKICKLDYVSIKRSLLQIAYSIFMLGKCRMPFLYRMLERLPFSKFGISLNTYDVMLVIARKQ